MKKYIQLFKINVNEDNYDAEDMKQDLEILKIMLNIRDLNMIFNHEILIEKEMILLFGADLPEPKPFFVKIEWEDLKEFETQINNAKKFDYKKLGLDKPTINEIDLLFSSFFDKYSESGSKNTISEEVKKDNLTENFSYTQEPKCNSAKIKKNIEDKNKFCSFISKDEKKNKSVNVNEKKLSIIEDGFPDNLIKHDDFRLNEKLENIEFNYYIPDNNIVGTLFEGEVTNYIYDIFNLLTLGHLSFYRNQKYDGKYELDFQIANIKLKDFLYFIGLLLPNIPTLKSLKIENIEKIYEDKKTIFQKINELDEKNSKYEFIDILGEITIDLLNIENKKLQQLNNYIDLILEMQKNEKLNEKCHFSPKNKKVIILITDGKVENFFKYFKSDNKRNKFKVIEEANIDHLFIYVKSKNNSESIIQEKVKFQYINLLEESLKEKNNPNAKIEKENLINQFQKLNFSEIYNDFYKKIVYSKKYDSLHEKIKIIISKYIKNIGKVYINFLKTKIDKEKVIESFMKRLNFDFQKKSIFLNMREEYNQYESKIIPNVSILEFSTTELRYKNYKKKDINITNYEGQQYDSNNIQIDTNFFDILKFWNKKNSDSSEKIIIYDTNENDLIFFAVSAFFKNKEFKDISFVFNKQLQAHSQIVKLDKIVYFSEKYELENIIIDIAKKNKFPQFVYSKLANKFSYFDKVLKNRIIVQKNDELPDNYLDQLIIKINQTISIYVNNDISQFNEIFFKEDIKKVINDNNKYNDSFIFEISSQIENIISTYFDSNSLSMPNMNKYFIQKLNSHKDYLTNIYYKFYEKIYSQFIKKNIKKIIINNLVKFNGENKV